MSRMVAYAKDLFDHSRCPRRGPDISNKAVGFGALRQQTRDLRPLLGRQSGLRTRGNTTAQRFDTSIIRTLEPLAYCAWGHAQGFGNTSLFPALLFEFPSTEPATFLPVPGSVRDCSLHSSHITPSRAMFTNLCSGL